MDSRQKSSAGVLAIIPARGGSKGLPGKNVMSLIGKPVLAYTADAALTASTVDRVILSTDSEDIAEIGRRVGLEVPFLRPEYLASDSSHPVDAINHALNFLNEREGYIPELVVTLQPTSPLRLPNHIDECVNMLRSNQHYDAVITVQEVVLPPYWMVKPQGDVLRPLIDDGVDYSLRRRQDLERTFKPNGAVYVSRSTLLKDKRLIFSTFSGGDTGYVLMSQLDSLEIDTETDFLVIEAVLRGKNQNEGC